jgi:hypothetical protein
MIIPIVQQLFFFNSRVEFEGRRQDGRFESNFYPVNIAFNSFINNRYGFHWIAPAIGMKEEKGKG